MSGSYVCDADQFRLGCVNTKKSGESLSSSGSFQVTHLHTRMETRLPRGLVGQRTKRILLMRNPQKGGGNGIRAMSEGKKSYWDM